MFIIKRANGDYFVDWVRETPTMIGIKSWSNDFMRAREFDNEDEANALAAELGARVIYMD